MGMDRTISNFIRALRNADVRVSTAETLDAISAVELVGYSDKAHLKRSLSMVLPKTADENTFDACFRSVFRFQDVRGESTSTAKTAASKRVRKAAKAVMVKAAALAATSNSEPQQEKVQIQGQKEQSVRRGRRGRPEVRRSDRRPLAIRQIADGEFPSRTRSVHGRGR